MDTLTYSIETYNAEHVHWWILTWGTNTTNGVIPLVRREHCAICGVYRA